LAFKNGSKGRRYALADATNPDFLSRTNNLDWICPLYGCFGISKASHVQYPSKPFFWKPNKKQTILQNDSV
jgi:hypothetical protein